MEERIKIAFDIDGVVLDFTECFLRVDPAPIGILKHFISLPVCNYSATDLR